LIACVRDENESLSAAGSSPGVMLATIMCSLTSSDPVVAGFDVVHVDRSSRRGRWPDALTTYGINDQSQLRFGGNVNGAMREKKPRPRPREGRRGAVDFSSPVAPQKASRTSAGRFTRSDARPSAVRRPQRWPWPTLGLRMSMSISFTSFVVHVDHGAHMWRPGGPWRGSPACTSQ